MILDLAHIEQPYSGEYKEIIFECANTFIKLIYYDDYFIHIIEENYIEIFDLINYIPENLIKNHIKLNINVIF